MFNQITFIFCKYGNILSMYLNKFCKSEKWKTKELKFGDENYISIVSKLFFFFKTADPILYTYSLNMQTTKASST